MTAVWVAFGAALGGVLRVVLGTRFDHLLRAGTLTANTLGSFLIGVAAGSGLGGTGWALGAIGFCGALTTWSSMAVQSVDEGPVRGTLLAVSTVVLAVVAVWVGHALTR